MFRLFITCFVFFFAVSSQSAIYQWTNEQGNIAYGQKPPRDKTIKTQKILLKSSEIIEVKQAESIQDSANEIAKSNAARKAANEKIQQEAAEALLLQERCATSKKSLTELDFGGNRLYKDSDGNYSRFSAEDKSQQREQLTAFINENCR